MHRSFKTRSSILSFLLILPACGESGATDESSSTSDSSAESGPSSTGEGTTEAGTEGETTDSAETSDTSETTGTSTTGTEPGEAVGCDGAPLYERPADPAARGPWPVGAITTQVNGFNVEVWYPAQFGSDAGVDNKRYDIRDQLPPSQQGVIPDADNPWQECDCADGLPLDTDHGPYPMVVFIHGTAAWRAQSLSQVTHWASRGFIVAAADYEGLKLAHTLALLCPDSGGNQNLSGDTDAVIAAVGGAQGDLSFLAGNVDPTRVGVAGHSAGGSAAANSQNKAGVRVVIPMASGTAVTAGSALESTLLMGADADAVVAYSGTQGAYDGSVSPKRLVGIGNGGHLAFSDICSIKNNSGKNILEIANDYGICGASAAGFLFDCSDTYLDDETSKQIVNYATTAVLEEVLQCREDVPDLNGIQSVYPDVSEYRQDL